MGETVGKQGGRPLVYRDHFAATARERCAQGAVGRELAKLFNVEPRTIRNWMNAYPEFGEAVAAGRKQAKQDRAAGALEPRRRTEAAPPRITRIVNYIVYAPNRRR